MIEEERTGGDAKAISEPNSTGNVAGGSSDGVEIPQGTPGTISVERREMDQGRSKIFKTIHISSSAKARARIRTCDKCAHDNIPEAKFCEGCGNDLDEQEEKKDFEKSMERLQEHDNRAQKTHEKKDGRTMLRRSKTPIMQPPVDIEKKSYHSHYIPPGVLGGHQFDPAAFRSDREAGPYQGPPPQPVPPQLYPPQGLQYIAVPVNYAVQAPQKKSQASLILGIVIISVLALLFIGLVVTIIVLAL